MADRELVERLKRGVDEWNAWRKRGVAGWTAWRRAERKRMKGIPLDLRGANFRHFNLVDAILCDTYLCYADFSGALLVAADLAGADLRRANFSGANLQNANLMHANLRDTILRKVNLSNASFRRADLRGADLSEANLSSAEFHHADLRGANLSDANLQSATLVEADLSGTKARGADFRHAKLYRVELSQTDLKNANLFQVDLESVFLDRASLEGADLRAAKFVRSEASGSHLGSSYLGLATCEGIETAIFERPLFLSDYLEDAFHFAQRKDTRDAEVWPEFVEEALKKIQVLRSLQRDQSTPSPALTQALDVLDAQLLDYLKRHPKQLYEIPPDVFEQIVAEVLSSFGWQVDLTPKSKDGGYDLFAVSPNIAGGVEASWIIECKRYAPHRKIDVSLVRALYGADAFREKQGSLKMLATTSFFTKDAWQMQSARYDLTLKDYGGVLDWINEYKPNPDGKLYLKGDRIVLK